MRRYSAGRVGLALVFAFLLAALVVSGASAGDRDHHKRTDSTESKQATTGTATATDSTAAEGTDTCSGSLNDFPNHVGVLSGTHMGNVQISGACAVIGGPAEVKGNLTVTAGSVLLATFGETFNQPGSPASTLTVDGSVMIQSGATALLGCFAASFPCFDDPSAEHPTLNSPVKIGGSLVSTEPLGVIVHDATIWGNVSQTGGGGGITCIPSGGFAAFGSPVYSAYEDSTVAGWMSISDVNSCWLGVARVHIGQSLSVTNNQMEDPDAIEIVLNTIEGNLSCSGNRMVWDSAEMGNDLYPRVWQPNTVEGTRMGQCEKAPSLERPGGTSPGPF
ncbi:MAG TPA: hypothetical protein VE982_01750 [Gaiellaceae bacterium]|nr:hypothetical protein [Gaiellaceae bacterium]